jgi:hypothetical protein
MRYSTAARVAYDEFLSRLQPALEAFPIASPGLPDHDGPRARVWAVATAFPDRGELERIGHLRLLRSPAADGLFRIEAHQEIELLFKTIATTEGAIVCRDDAWRSLESWHVAIRQRFTTPAPKKFDRSFDRVSKGRALGSSFEVDGQPALDCGQGPIVHELSLLEDPSRLVEAGQVHVSRDFDALVNGQRFSSLGRAKTPWGDLEVVLQSGPASLPVTYWIRPSGSAALVRHGARLWVEIPSADQSQEDDG